TTQNALSFSFNASIRERHACVASTGDARFARYSRRRFVAERSWSFVDIVHLSDGTLRLTSGLPHIASLFLPAHGASETPTYARFSVPAERLARQKPSLTSLVAVECCVQYASSGGVSAGKRTE